MRLIPFLLHRTVHAVIVLLALCVLVFCMLLLIPGDPALTVAGVGASQADIEGIRHQLMLDEPVYVRFWSWFSALLHGDWGVSIISHDKVLPLLVARFRMTFILAFAGVTLATSVGVFLGIRAAIAVNTGKDVALSLIALAGVSAPIFWIGMLLQLAFAVRLHWLPATGSGSLASLALPAIAIGANSTGVIMRMTRSSMLEALGQDYVRTARAKGLERRAVIYRHALRNALIPMVTVVGMQFAYLMGGAVLTESVFVWPGIGRLLADAVFHRDFPVVQGAILFIGLFFVVVNTVVDLLYGVIDPRIRVS